MSATTVTKARKTAADYTRAAREKMREALAMAKKADALAREAARDELRAAEMKAKEKTAALAAKEKATKTAKPTGVIVTDGVGRKITLPVTVADVFQKTLGKRRHGSFLLSSVEADNIVDALTEDVCLSHNKVTVQFPRGNSLIFTVERDELLTWNTVPRVARKTA